MAHTSSGPHAAAEFAVYIHTSLHIPPSPLPTTDHSNPTSTGWATLARALTARQISAWEPLQLARSRRAANANLRHAALGVGEDRPSSASFASSREL